MVSMLCYFKVPYITSIIYFIISVSLLFSMSYYYFYVGSSIILVISRPMVYLQNCTHYNIAYFVIINTFVSL